MCVCREERKGGVKTANWTTVDRVAKSYLQKIHGDWGDRMSAFAIAYRGIEGSFPIVDERRIVVDRDSRTVVFPATNWAAIEETEIVEKWKSERKSGSDLTWNSLFYTLPRERSFSDEIIILRRKKKKAVRFDKLKWDSRMTRQGGTRVRTFGRKHDRCTSLLSISNPLHFPRMFAISVNLIRSYCVI